MTQQLIETNDNVPDFSKFPPLDPKILITTRSITRCIEVDWLSRLLYWLGMRSLRRKYQFME